MLWTGEADIRMSRERWRFHSQAARLSRTARLIALIGVLCISTLHATPSGATNPGDLGDSDLVISQFADMLYRQPTGEELTYWTRELRAGVEAADIVEHLIESEEFATRVAPVIRLYQAHLDRVPDHGGLQFWVTQVRSGRTLADISEEFARSPEFAMLYGALNNHEYVERVYLNVLGRPAEAEGKAYWLQRLEDGTTRGTVMALFSESVEFRGQTTVEVVTSLLYVGLLGRQPDALGMEFWSDQIELGMAYSDAAAVFLSLEEYSAKQRAQFASVHPLTGQRTNTDTAAPALALKVDNTEMARPQVGINQADVVYEELVEGNLTRFIAVFHSQLPSEVGPIRSIRTGDFDVLGQLNTPLLGASGGNNGVLAALETAAVVNVNALVGTGAYFRSENRFAPHNLMVSPSVLLDVAGERGESAPGLFAYRPVGSSLPSGATPVTAVMIDYGRTRVGYEWDANRQGWVRTQNGTTHVDSLGHAIAPDNVVVQVTEYGVSAADAESPEAVTIGEGEVLVFTQGVLITGTWSRSSASDVIQLTDRFGQEIKLSTGTTWVSLAPRQSFTVSN